MSLSKHVRAAVLSLIGAMAANPAEATSILVTSTPILKGGTRIGIAINAASMGRACGIIGGVVVGQDPVGACTPLNGPIPPVRGPITVFDGAGNSVNVVSDKTAALFGFKSYFVSATSTAITKATFAQAEFVDPLTFSDPSGAAFTVDLTPSFADEEGHSALTLSGSGASTAGTGQFTEMMSSSLTGSLFSLNLSFALGQTLGIDLTLGSYLTGLPGWDKSALEDALRTALGATSTGNNFSLHNFSFPDIPISVPAGATLSVFTDDIATAAAVVPEPGTLSALGTGILSLIGIARLGRRPNSAVG
jgi:hypothetical protein